MGHASTMSNSYLEEGNGIFVQAYVKVEPYITVFGLDNTVVTELHKKQADMEAGIRYLVVQNQKLKEQISDIYDFVHKNLDPLVDLVSEPDVAEFLQQRAKEE